jgi:hypothetical protein
MEVVMKVFVLLEISHEHSGLYWVKDVRVFKSEDEANTASDELKLPKGESPFTYANWWGWIGPWEIDLE